MKTTEQSVRTPKLRSGFTQIPNTWISNLPPDLTPVERLLMFVIKSNHEDFEPTYDMLVTATGSNRKTVWRSLMNLRHRGYVLVRRRTDERGHVRHAYSVNDKAVNTALGVYHPGQRLPQGSGNHGHSRVSLSNSARLLKETLPPQTRVAQGNCKKPKPRREDEVEKTSRSATGFPAPASASGGAARYKASDTVTLHTGVQMSVAALLDATARRPFSAKCADAIMKYGSLTENRVGTLIAIYNELDSKAGGEHGKATQVNGVDRGGATDENPVEPTQRRQGSDPRVSPAVSADQREEVRRVDGAHDDLGRASEYRAVTPTRLPKPMPPLKHPQHCRCDVCLPPKELLKDHADDCTCPMCR